MASWEPNDFRTIELDRESRVPDELYPSCTERGPLASPEEADDDAGTDTDTASPRSVEDAA